jgi:hypothetical protein
VKLAPSVSGCVGIGGLNMLVNKVAQVTTIARGAEQLGESVEWLYEVANEMDTEDGVIWVYGLGEDGRHGVHRLRNRKPRRADQYPQGFEVARQGLTRRSSNRPVGYGGCLRRLRKEDAELEAKKWMDVKCLKQ